MQKPKGYSLFLNVPVAIIEIDYWLCNCELVSYFYYRSMWQAYQYGHGKLKLVKDLKTGQAHLRVSLIDQEEIDNMGKVHTLAFRSTNNEKYTIK